MSRPLDRPCMPMVGERPPPGCRHPLPALHRWGPGKVDPQVRPRAFPLDLAGMGTKGPWEDQDEVGVSGP